MPIILNSVEEVTTRRATMTVTGLEKLKLYFQKNNKPSELGTLSCCFFFQYHSILSKKGLQETNLLFVNDKFIIAHCTALHKKTFSISYQRFH